MALQHGLNSRNWRALRNQIKSTYSQLSDENLESLRDDLQRLSESLQSAYGMTKDAADREAERFCSGFSEIGNSEKLPGLVKQKRTSRISGARKTAKTNRASNAMAVDAALYGVH